MDIDATIQYLIREGHMTQDEFNKKVKDYEIQSKTKVFDYTDLDIDAAKELKKDEMKYMCEKAIVHGFTSEKNGHHYRTNRDDQTNMIGQKDDLMDDETITHVQWKTEDVGYIEHTREDWLYIYKEAFAHKKMQLFKYDQSKKDIDALVELEDVLNYKWG